MKTTYFHNATLNKHGVDITTDTGETFGIACPDEQTARMIAAGGEAIRILEALLIEVNKEDAHCEGNLLSGIYPVMDKAQALLTNLHAQP